MSIDSFSETISDKIFEKSKKIKQNWIRPEKSYHYICMRFYCYCQKIAFREETSQ